MSLYSFQLCSTRWITFLLILSFFFPVSAGNRIASAETLESASTLPILPPSDVDPASTLPIPQITTPAISPVTSTADKHVSMNMKNVGVVEIVQLLANSAGLNIVVPDDLEGTVSVKLNNVYWEDALDSILRTKGFSYQKQGNVLRIDSMDRLKNNLVSRVFQLKYVDATDMQPFLEGILSENGKITTLIEKGRASYAFGGDIASNEKQEGAVGQKSRIFTITDTQAVIDVAEKMIAELDVEPQQIAIEVKLLEVVTSKNQDLGIKWNLEAGMKGASQPTTFPFPSGAVGGPFLPDGTSFPTPDTGSFLFGALDASKLAATLQMLQTKGELNVLSSPKITTLNNLEASILVGEHFPITTESIDAETGTRTITLDHYEAIGIHLVVIPQISGQDAINMIIHPSVSSLGALVENRYPRINTREADTQVLINNNDTIVIGGLLEDRDTANITKVPLLGSIPILKYLFRHKSNATQKVELLIFVTPHIVQGAGNALARSTIINTVPEDIEKKVDRKLGLEKKPESLSSTTDPVDDKPILRRNNKYRRGKS